MAASSRSASALLPMCAVVSLLVALALTLDYGLGAGLPHESIEFAGLLYFALLLGAPLVLYPLAWRAGLGRAQRALLSLAPGVLWWMSEVGFRLEGHSFAEAVWLAVSPFNVFHLSVVLTTLVLADVGCRVVERRTNPVVRAPSWKRISLMVFGIPAGFGAAVVWVPGFLFGYHSFFQSELLPVPETRSGPLLIESGEAPNSEAQRPNIVFILSDDHRADFTGYAGHPFVETPALDRLAREGVRFNRAYVTSSLCSPSRASFLTGQRPALHGVWNNFTPWSNENRTFFEYLSQAGYETAFVGKWHMPGQLPELRGVDHFTTFTNMGGQGLYEWNPLVVDGKDEPSTTRYIATELTNRALAWLGERVAARTPGDQARPFALMLSHKSVHADFVPDEPDRGRYADAGVNLPEGAHAWSHQTRGQYAHMTYTPLASAIRRYGEAIASMDREIGRVLDWLDEQGLAENTLVIYASDNGYLWGEHGLTDKRWAYEESIRIPLLARLPALGHPKGASSEAIVANIDLAPTLVELAGWESPEHMQGRSFASLLRDPSTQPTRDALLYSYYFEPPYPAPTVSAIVTPKFKYVETEGVGERLYDLSLDPGELHDAIDDLDPGVSTALKRRLAQLRVAARSPGLEP